MTEGSNLTRLKMLLNVDVFRNIALGSFWSLAIKFGSAALSYLMIVLFAQSMTTTEFGQFSLAFSLGSVLAVASSAGLHTAVLRWVPEYRSTDRDEVAGYALRWSTLMTFLTSLAVSVATFVVLIAIYRHGPIPNYLLAMIVLIVPLAMSEFIGSALRASGSIIFSQLPKDILWRFLAISVASGYIFYNLPMSSTFAILFLAISLTVLVFPQVVVSRSRVPSPTALDNTAELRRDWLSQLPPMWGIALLYASTQYIDVVIVSQFLSNELAGAYFSASRTALLVSLMLVASVMVTAPMISTAYHSGDREALQRVLRFAALCGFLPTLLFVVVLICIGRPLLTMFDPAFGIAFPVLIFLAIAQGLNALSGPMSYLMQLTGHGNQNFKIIAGCYAVGLIAQLLLIPRIGMIGAAFGSGGAIIVWNLLSWRFVTKKLKVDPTILSLFRHPRTAAET